MSQDLPLSAGGGPVFGKYRGVVTEVDAATVTVKAMVPAVLAEQATGWCAPCVPYAGPQVGFIMLPEVGSGVWIEFEAGDISKPIWSGCFWRADEVPSEASADIKTIMTKAGTLAFDNATPAITLADPDEQQLAIDSDGVTLKVDPKKVVVSSSSVSVNDGALEVS